MRNDIKIIFFYIGGQYEKVRPFPTILAIILIAGIAFVGLSNGKTKTIKEGGVLSVNDIQADPFASKRILPSQDYWQKGTPLIKGLRHYRDLLEAKILQADRMCEFLSPGAA